MDIWNMSEAFFEIINIFKSLKNTEVEKHIYKNMLLCIHVRQQITKGKKISPEFEDLDLNDAYFMKYYFPGCKELFTST